MARRKIVNFEPRSGGWVGVGVGVGVVVGMELGGDEKQKAEDKIYV